MPKPTKTRKKDRGSVDNANDLKASPERATEIACMQDFGLREFIELTGVGEGDYGIYSITESGVILRSSGDPLRKTLPAQEQVKALDAEELFKLKFRCTPVEFQRWYEATCGTNRISDFPIADGFLQALVKDNESARAASGPPKPSSAIIAAFKVQDTDRENNDWWDARLRAAKRYGLKDARASKGRAQQQSQWYPTLIATWLIQKDHLPRSKVKAALAKHFPDADSTYLT